MFDHHASNVSVKDHSASPGSAEATREPNVARGGCQVEAAEGAVALPFQLDPGEYNIRVSHDQNTWYNIAIVYVTESDETWYINTSNVSEIAECSYLLINVTDEEPPSGWQVSVQDQQTQWNGPDESPAYAGHTFEGSYTYLDENNQEQIGTAAMSVVTSGTSLIKIRFFNPTHKNLNLGDVQHQTLLLQRVSRERYAGACWQMLVVFAA